MATAFPIDYDDIILGSDSVDEQIFEENTKHPIRIFYDVDDDVQNPPDRPYNRGRGNQRRERARTTGRGRGRGDRFREESGDRGNPNDGRSEMDNPYRGGKNMRGNSRSGRYRNTSSSNRSSWTRKSDTDKKETDREADCDSSHRYTERGRRNYRGGERRSASHTRYPIEDSVLNEQDIEKSTEVVQGATRRRYNLKKLVELSKTHEDADGLLLEIASSRSGFADLLNSEIKPDWFYYILKILAIAITSSKKRTLIEVLVLVEKCFLSQLGAILGEISAKTQSHRNIWVNSKTLSISCIMILQVLKELVKTINTALGKSKNILINVKEIVSEFGLIEVNINIQKEIVAVDEVFRAVVDEREKLELQKKSLKSQRYIQNDEEGLPPEDFRELSVLPRLRDVQMDEKPFLRANRSKGKYDDLDTYLDIQFRLLREDFIQPLRAGIAEYIQSLTDGNASKKIRDIRLYRNVQIARPVCTSDGISYIIQFDTSTLKRINWTTTQRLKYGSLLCLSKDHFQTIFYATVKDRNISELNEGFVRVHFETMPCTERSETFLMAESTAYFEAFRHVLEGLKTVDSSLPFQRYLVECNTAIKPPQYLLKAGVALYDFRSILSQNTKECRSAHVPVLNITRWPKSEDLDLDASQYAALQQAITKELAVIQGPPGTGKTFIGLKIAQLLIENKSFWKPDKKTSPVLVVCFTNHALDQFLEGILTFCQTGIVRVGGRCSNKALERCILRNLKREKTKERSRSWSILQNERDCLREMSECQREIHRISAELKKTFANIISFNRLKDHMSYEQQESFEKNLNEEQERNYITSWLGFQGLSISPEEEECPTKLPEEHLAKRLWTEHLLKTVEEMPASEAVFISDPTSINLQERAKLFKAWSLEFTQEIDKIKCKAEGSQKKTLSSLILRSKIDIIHPNVMLQYVQSTTTKTQIRAILRTMTFEAWLAIDGSKSSASAIKDAIENTDDKIVENDDDMSEEREVDSDDEETLFDYTHEDVKSRAHRSEVSKVTEGNWLVKWDAKIERENVQNILRNAADISDTSANRIDDVFSVDKSERKKMYKYWITKYRECLKESVTGSEKRFNELTERLKEVRDAETIQIMQEAHVIGMTTTGAAKHRKSLQDVKPSIVIVEEAAEVLESHVVTALSEGCKHLILIGDHKQLRPSTTVYELAKRYQFDISLFERMIKNSIPCVTLSEQHRMRPEISCLLKNEFLYPSLQDHAMVFKYDHVRGIDSDAFFIEHGEDEVKVQDSTSCQNPHEAKFLAGLCKYLLQQGYDRSQITILSPYMGQVSLLRREMPKSEFEGVRITAVDNFQGEENDIILLSLVRSRTDDQLHMKKNPIGFLAIENRICVALSRAKMGLYVVGNFSHIRDHSKLWQHIVGKMSASRRLGKEITLRCQNHPQKVIKASSFNDFKQAPDGGCKEPCGGRLKCNHFCPRVCHIIDREHAHIKCLKPCPKTFDKCGHRCLNKCWEDCGNCETTVTKILPMCDHTAKMPCHRDPYNWNCVAQCKFKLPCGHECTRHCNVCTKSKSHEVKCKVKVSRELACGHPVKMGCFQDPTTFTCSHPCHATLTCGHSCNGSCGACLRGKIHKICQNSCEKTLPCGHRCRGKCSDLCPPCTLPCEWTCSHRKRCRKRCFEECEKCVESCQYTCSCKHSRCTQLCHEMCDREPCETKCTNTLKCGHSCGALCGDLCLCSEFCSSKNNKYISMYEKDTVYIKLSGCGCIVPQSLLDTHMRQPSRSRSEFIKKCPDCSKPVSASNPRYSNILKQSRQEVVRKFAAIVGTEHERSKRTLELDTDVSNLLLLGLGVNEQESLRSRLKPNLFGSLHIIGKVVELLKDILTVQQKIKAFPHATLVLTPSQIKDLVLKERKYATAQFWDEIRNEIKRIDYYVQLESYRQNASDGFAGSLKEELYLKCKEILKDHAPLSHRRKEVVEKAIGHLKIT